MPFDRQITVNVEALGTRNAAREYIPGPVTPYAVWASKYDLRLIDVEEAGGVRSEVRGAGASVTTPGYTIRRCHALRWWTARRPST